jgi:sugar fermentation stimulation protein A
MMGCALPGNPVLLSFNNSPHRKLCYTWELVKENGIWVGINTGLPNKLTHEAIENGVIPELTGYETIRPEVKYGENSRIDLLLSGAPGLCYVEVKNVTLVKDDMALFPDAVTLRGQKHLRELMLMVQAGNRGVIFFVVQHGDASRLAPADAIDPEYGRLLRLAVKNGVEAMAYQADVNPREIVLVRSLPVLLD